MDRGKMKACKNKFCVDTVDYIFPALDRLASEQSSGNNIHVILQFGDAEKYKAYTADGSGKTLNYPMVPVIKKFRYTLEASERERVTQQRCYAQGETRALVAVTQRHSTAPSHYNQSIVSIVSNYDRHFGTLVSVPKADT